MTTFTISLPDQTAHQIDSEAKRLGFASRSEFIRDVLRKEFFPRLTVNGFTEEFEDEVLKSAAEPMENDIVLETDKDIHDYFINLKIPSKIKVKKNDKSSIGAQI